MSRRDRRSALRAVEAAVADAAGKLGGLEPEPGDASPTPDTIGPRPTIGAEALLPETWRERVDEAAAAESVELHGERVRRRVEEETVYLATRVPRSLRDAVRRRADRLDVSMQDLILLGMQVILEATARVAEEAN